MKPSPWSLWLLSALLTAGLGWVAPAAAASGSSVAPDDLFLRTNLLAISITLSDEGRRTLREMPSISGHSKPKGKAVVQEGGRSYRDVAVQLKGTTSFQSLDDSPSLTLDFNQFVTDQRFHGLDKISLNNSLQDPTRLHEKLARELFAAAGVPVPQANYAMVTLDGRPLGLYVLVEGFGRSFLKRHFQDARGKLYEAGRLQDIDEPLQLKSGSAPGGRSDLARLLRASRVPDPVQRFAALEAVVDLERLFSMVAVESMLCHSDSYSMNRNNYRIYHDPSTDRFVFLPHGMDRILGTHRSSLDLSIVPPAMGVVVRAVLSTKEGRRRYVARAGILFTNLFDAERLGARVDEIDAAIVDVKRRFPGARESWGDGYSHPATDASNLRYRIQKRAEELKLQFAQLPNLLAISSVPEFDSLGVARLTDWRIRWNLKQPPAELSLAIRDGRPLMRIRSAGEVVNTTLYCRVNLPLDHYHLSGQCASVSPPDLQIPLTSLRYSVEKFQALNLELGTRGADYRFQVDPTLNFEEVEFICEISASTNTVWLDPGSLVLRRDISPRE